MSTIDKSTMARLLDGGAMVWPHPRKKTVSVNGQRAQRATPAAMRMAVNHRDERRAAEQLPAMYEATSALNLGDWRPGFTRVIFSGPAGRLAIELPSNMYRAVCGGSSCGGRTMADFAPLFSTGLVRTAPASFSDYYTRGRVTIGETFAGTPLVGWELDEWVDAQPA